MIITFGIEIEEYEPFNICCHDSLATKQLPKMTNSTGGMILKNMNSYTIFGIIHPTDTIDN